MEYFPSIIVLILLSLRNSESTCPDPYRKCLSWCYIEINAKELPANNDCAKWKYCEQRRGVVSDRMFMELIVKCLSSLVNSINRNSLIEDGSQANDQTSGVFSGLLPGQYCVPDKRAMLHSGTFQFVDFRQRTVKYENLCETEIIVKSKVDCSTR